MNSVYEKLANGNYTKVTLYPNPDIYIKVCDCGCVNCKELVEDVDGWFKDCEKWVMESSEKFEQFRKDVLEEVGLHEHPKRDKIFEKAWKEFDLGGYYGVLRELESLAELVQLLKILIVE